MKVDKKTRLFKIPYCGHIFRVDVLDVYVERKLKSLPLGVPLSCPACPGSLILARNTWRYSGPLMKRHAQQQQVKTKVLERSSVSESLDKKIWASLSFLSPDVKKTFFTSEVGKRHDVNQAFVLTNQIKLAYVIHEISDGVQ